MIDYRIGHLEIEAPWGNAGGVLKSVEDVEDMAHTGVGFMEAGSYTLESRPGNQGEAGEISVYWHDSETGETANSLGMPNKGMDVVEKEIPEMTRIAEAYNKALLINVAPVSGDPVAETQELVERVMAAGAPGVILNASCPNVISEDGERHDILSLCPEPFGLVLNGLRGIVEKYNQKISVRVSPQRTYQETEDTMTIIRLSGVVGAVFATNTFPGFKPMRGGEYMLGVPGNSGGRSGRITAPESREQTAWTVEALEFSGINVVSCSGIDNAKELHTRLGLGAVAGSGTTFYREAAVKEGWPEATDRFLRNFIETA